MLNLLKKTFDLKGVFVGFLFFCVIALITFYGFYYSKEKYESEVADNFEQNTATVESLVARRMQIYINALYNAKAFVSTTKSINAKDWKDYVASAEILNRYPGIFAISYIERVLKDGKDAFAKSVINDKSLEADGYPQFSIHPASEADVSYVIKYIEPFAGRQAAFGLDWGTDPIRSEALNLAIKSGDPKLSRVYTSASTGESVFGAIIPAKSDEFGVQSLVLFTFSPNELFKNILNDFALDSQIRLEIYQPKYQKNEAIKIFDTNVVGGVNILNSYQKENETQFLGQRWLFRFTSLAGYSTLSREETVAYLMLIFGILFAMTVAILSYKIIATNSNIKTKIEKTNRELESERKRLEIIFHNSPDTVLVVGFNEAGGLGNFLDANKVAIERLGYSKEELLKMSPASLQDPKSSNPVSIPKLTEDLLRTGNSNFEIEVLSKDKRVLPAEIKATLIDFEERKAILLIARDIAERKKIENRLKEKLVELEKLNKLLLGREIKMVKIKEELEALKNLNEKKS